MINIENIRQSKFFKILIPIIIFPLWFVVVWKATGICFETNDDRLIGEILSGSLTGGHTEGHVVYINYLLSVPLSLLYKVTSDIPWYGWSLVVFQIFAYIMLMINMQSYIRTIKEYIILLGICGCFCLINLYITGAITYTSTAALLAMMGYACLILSKHQKNVLITFGIFEFIALLLRNQAMLMLQPLGLMVYIGVIFYEKETGIREKLKRIVLLFCIIAIIFSLGYCGDLVGYHNSEWKEYTRFNNARTELFDYYDQPEYENVKPVLDKYGVSRKDYQAFFNYVIIGESISTECLEELVEYVKIAQNISVDIPDFVEGAWNFTDSTKFLKVNQIAGIAWCLAIIWLCITKHFYMLIPLSGLALGKTIVWGFLIYRGRLPFRVTLPLISCEIILLLTLVISDYAYTPKTVKRNSVAFFMSIVFILFSVFVGKTQYHELLKTSTWQAEYTKGLTDVRNYCERHADSKYLVECWSVIYYRGSAFETDIYGKTNSTYMGCWYSNSPVLKNYQKQYLGDDQEDIHLIISDEENGSEFQVVEFFEEKTGGNFKIVDKIITSNGAGYLVFGYE